MSIVNCQLSIVSGLLFSMMPIAVHAQTALSPWVQKVIERSNEGLSMASGLGGTNTEPNTVIAAIQSTKSMASFWIMTVRDLAMESQFLREQTVCFEYDRRLLEAQLEILRGKLNTAIGAGRLEEAGATRDNYGFVAGAMASLMLGGENPTYRDDRLAYRYPFHDLNLWQSASQPVDDSNSSTPICPYTTDYGPHSYGYVLASGAQIPDPVPVTDIRSYGCDSTVLVMLNGDPLLMQESSSLQNFLTASRSYSETLYNQIRNTLTLFPGWPLSAFDPAAPMAPHEAKSGCLRPTLPQAASGAFPGGMATNNPASLLESIFIGAPDYFDRINLNPGGSYDPQDSSRLPLGILLRNTYDLFLTNPNPAILDRAFIQRKDQIGRSRPLPQDITTLTAETYFFNYKFQREYPRISRDVSANIENEVGILEAVSRDAMTLGRDTNQDFTDAVDAFVNIVTPASDAAGPPDEDAGFLPEKYIPDLAYFLLRSCVDGPCQKTLDSVLKRTFNPWCQPYVSGIYVEDKAQKKCFCDPSMESADPGFWRDYCSPDYSTGQGRYNSMEEKLIPACLAETSSSARSL